MPLQLTMRDEVSFFEFSKFIDGRIVLSSGTSDDIFIDTPLDLDPEFSSKEFEVHFLSKKDVKENDIFQVYDEGRGKRVGWLIPVMSLASAEHDYAENEHFLKAANFAIKKKVDIWIVIYQSSGIDVHTGVTGLAGMPKSIIAMSEIKKAGIPTFAIAARAVAGGTFGSSFFMHDFIIIESKYVENLLFSGKRVTANILKNLDQIPEDFGTASSVIKSGLADMTLENRKELKDTLVKLGSIILKKEVSLDKKDSTSDIPEEQIPTSLQKTSEAV